MVSPDLWWLPESPNWSDEFRSASAMPAAGWEVLCRLANFRMDFVRTERLDNLAQRIFGDDRPPEAVGPPVRLAILGSSTISHLIPAIRVGLLRRGIWAKIYTNSYGQYLQELFDPNSALHDFKPSVILFALDARHALGKIDAAADAASSDRTVEAVANQYQELWRMARRAFSCTVIQQTVLPLLPALLGSNEHR